MQYEQDDTDHKDNVKEPGGYVEREQSQQPHYDQNRGNRC